MNKLLELGIATTLVIFTTLFVGSSFNHRLKTTTFPIRYDRKIYIWGTFFIAFLMLEALLGIYFYHLPWNYYIVVAVSAFAASLLIARIAQRKYKWDHPDEPTNIKRPTFREAFREANKNTDPVTVVLSLGFILVVFTSAIFHQPLLIFLAIPLILGPLAIYQGVKMLREAQNEHQSDSVHWYTQYRILFGISAVLYLPTELIMQNAPLSFVQTLPYHDLIENVLLAIFIIPMIASGFFFVRRYYLRTRKLPVE